MPTTQGDRILQVLSPLGGDVLLAERFAGTEELGRMFEYELALRSEDEKIDLGDIIGRDMTVKLALDDGSHRFFHGIVSRFRFAGATDRYAHYHATLHPWLWFLTRTTNCRVFQEMSVPDIVKQILQDRGYSDIKDSLQGSYDPREFCVQYRETDFDFISRLMETEGIYYHFEHEEGKHTLVLADDPVSHVALPGGEELAYFPEEGRERRDVDHVFDWLVEQEVQPGKYALKDYDFTAPRKDLLVRRAVQADYPGGDYEVYDYPGSYCEVSGGEKYARIRVEECQSRHERFEARGNVRALTVGYTFKLSGYPREDQNQEYLIVRQSFAASTNRFKSGVGPKDVAVDHQCRFDTIRSSVPYRAPRVTPRPVVQGPQTAMVVGKSGELIWTDEHGRIKVQFHWDREGKQDENSSCWVRVCQNRAGKGWGEMYIPHVGQEVVVSFLEGDPDQPLVTGRLYNGDNKPPIELPGLRTMTAMRDHGGSEMIMEGNDGGQRITMFTPTGASRFSMGAGFNPDPGFHWDTADNWTADIGTDQTVHVKGKRAHTTDGTNHEIVKGKETVEAKAGRDLTVTGNQTYTITGKEDKKDCSVDYWNSGFEKAGYAGIKQETHLGAKHELFAGVKVANALAAEITIAAGLKIEKSKTKHLTESPFQEHEAGISYKIKAPSITLEGTADVTIKVGGSQIDIGSGGIDIKAPKVTIDGSTKIITDPLNVTGELKDKNVKG